MVRSAIVTYLRAHPPPFHELSVNQSVRTSADGTDTSEIVEIGAPTLEEYLELMAQPTTWGDQITLRACATAYGATVCLITTYADHGSEEWYSEIRPPPGKADRARRVIRIGFHSGMHYVTTE